MRMLKDNNSIREFLTLLENRGAGTNQEGFAAERSVRAIINDVKTQGDAALHSYTARFDCDSVEYYRVPEVELIRTYRNYEEDHKDFMTALRRCHANITEFHAAQKREGYALTKESGVITGQRVAPLETVGLYVPGGTAAYPSSVLMNA
ncbi:MAG: histidinol dehydrogenase, partial [Oscillospiraceae bacterium]|nr:histidinol dehydrogenase [Oscillospiraceae bacterium]